MNGWEGPPLAPGTTHETTTGAPQPSPLAARLEREALQWQAHTAQKEPLAKTFDAILRAHGIGGPTPVPGNEEFARGLAEHLEDFDTLQDVLAEEITAYLSAHDWDMNRRSKGKKDDPQS